MAGMASSLAAAALYYNAVSGRVHHRHFARASPDGGAFHAHRRLARAHTHAAAHAYARTPRTGIRGVILVFSSSILTI